jgi:hypothetical protein
MVSIERASTGGSAVCVPGLLLVHGFAMLRVAEPTGVSVSMRGATLGVPGRRLTAVRMSAGGNGSTAGTASTTASAATSSAAFAKSARRAAVGNNPKCQSQCNHCNVYKPAHSGNSVVRLQFCRPH